MIQPTDPQQFDISSHYDLMGELDRDVHDNRALSTSEAQLAMTLATQRRGGRPPKTVFLPCVGTGRHIGPLLDLGVELVVGADLSPACLDKARTAFRRDGRVKLMKADLCRWQPERSFDAVFLLGNSYGDLIELPSLMNFTSNITGAMADDGVFVMDYIGTNDLERAYARQSATWDAVLNGRPVKDKRTPRFDADTGIMTIDVEVTDVDSGKVVATSAYQKRIFDDPSLTNVFETNARGLTLVREGLAHELNPYYQSHSGELGMIARSAWWSASHAR